MDLTFTILFSLLGLFAALIVISSIAGVIYKMENPTLVNCELLNNGSNVCYYQYEYSKDKKIISKII